MLELEWWRGNAIASPPHAHIPLSVHEHSHLLVEACEGAVVPLVQPPVAHLIRCQHTINIRSTSGVRYSLLDGVRSMVCVTYNVSSWIL